MPLKVPDAIRVTPAVSLAASDADTAVRRGARRLAARLPHAERRRHRRAFHGGGHRRLGVVPLVEAPYQDEARQGCLTLGTVQRDGPCAGAVRPQRAPTMRVFISLVRGV